MEEPVIYLLLFIAKMFGGEKAIELIENNKEIKEEDKKKAIEFLKRDMH